MKLKHLPIAAPLFFEAIAGSIIKFWYLDIWVWTYVLFPRRHNINNFIWATGRPGLRSFKEHLDGRLHLKYWIGRKYGKNK